MSERENADIMDAATAAVFTGLAVATLAKLRCRGGGPPYLKLGRKVVYRRADLADWLSARRVANTAQAALCLPGRLTEAPAINTAHQPDRATNETQSTAID
jgi:Helix-turn-helix domain